VALIQREAANARKGLPARIIAKMNALLDRNIIEALYEASQAGVKIDLIVRGICCLRPQIKGVSENINVRSVVDRFLEHSRIFYFENARQPRVFLSSADWLPRNFFRRVELAFPIEDGVLRDRLINEILAVSLADNTKARFLSSDGSYHRPRPLNGDKPQRSQMEFMELAVNDSAPTAHRRSTKPKFARVKLAKRPF